MRTRVIALSSQLREYLIENLTQEDSIKVFIDDMIEYWQQIREEVGKNQEILDWKFWEKYMGNLLPITENLYLKWKNVFTRVEAYIDSFFSIILQFKGGSILLPRQIILFESLNPKIDLLEELKSHPTLETFEMVLFSLIKDLNIKLRRNDLRIIQKLINPRFSKSLDQFPKNRELAYAIRSDSRTVASSLQYMFSYHILSSLYLVNTSRIGYKSTIFYHTKQKPELEEEIRPFISLSFPLSTDGKKNLTVIQYPYTDTSKFALLQSFFDTDSVNPLTMEFKGWNFASLTSQPSKRWKHRPPLIQSGGSWNKKVLSGKVGLEYNLDPEFDPYELSMREARVLAYISKYSSFSDAALEKELGISRAYIKSDWKQLLRNKIITRFPIFRNLGLNSWLYISIRNFLSLDHINLRDIVEHLKFFPYSNLLYDSVNGDLAGVINLPSDWLTTLIFRLANLTKINPECSYNYYIGPDSYNPWGFDIEGTYNWNR